MPEIKNTFTQGKMNQDLDERIVPNGQYIDAMNIKVTSSDDASVGVVQNILGNYRVESVVPPDSGYVCIATIANEKTNKLYWFVTQQSAATHAILQYDLKTEDTKFVLVDKKNDTLKFTQNIITGINIIDNLLFWTDNYNEPKKINIDNCIEGTDQSVSDLDSALHTKLVVDGVVLVDDGVTIDIEEKHITVIKKSPKQPPSITINKPTSTNTPKLFEQVFPRFSFRYRYEDGEYSSFGPFTQVVFNPVYVDGEYGREDAYSTKDSHNLAMINYIESIEISNFISSNTPKDVAQVEILYKEDGSSVVFSIKKINYNDIDWTNNSCTLKSESIFAAIPSNQFLRSWDNVPKKALAQEITGNRIVYANYTQGYDLIASDNIKVGNKINASFGLRQNNSTFNFGGLPSLKTQRNYQVGFVWGDKYGRETPVFTSEEGGVNIAWNDSTFGLLASQSLFLKTNLDTFIPTWADYYKVYVKETSGDYYNLLMEKAYPQSHMNVFDFEEDRVWLAFPSADRNKVSEDDYLIIKKQLTGDHSQIPLENKFKILDIQNEAPDAIKFEYTSLGKATQQSDGSGSYLSSSLFSSSGFRIDRTVDMIHINKDEWLNTLGGASLSPDDHNDNLHVKDLYIYWRNGVDESERYKVIGINVSGISYRLKLQKNIEEHDAKLADVGGVADADPVTNLHVDLQFFIDRKDKKDDDEFSGKFFVQIVYKPPTAPSVYDANSPVSITGQSELNWLYDPITAGSIDGNGIINVGNDDNPAEEDTSEVNTGNSGLPTTTLVQWDALATAMANNGGSGFFIDNMYMVAGQPGNSLNSFAKLSGKIWMGWKEGGSNMTPRWDLIDETIGEYGWTTDPLTTTPGGFIQSEYTPLDATYSPRPFSRYGGDNVLDVTQAMNGLEGFLTTRNEHIGNTINAFGQHTGFRRWKGGNAFGNISHPLAGSGDDTYGFAENNGPDGHIGGFQENEEGRYFIHLSFLAPGEDLHDRNWGLNPWLAGDENLKGINSPGNHMQAIWGGGVFTDGTKILEMEGNYDASGNPLTSAPGPNVGQGYNTGPGNIYRTKHEKQWDPTWPPSDKSDAIEEFINNIVDGATFHFSSKPSEKFTIKGDKKIKKIYNHTPWVAQYKWNGTGDPDLVTPTVNNNGLVLCGNSVDEAAELFLNDTTNSTTFEDFQNKITDFGKANNRRVVYIFEVDKNPVDIVDLVDSPTDFPFDSNSPLDIVFTSSSPNVLLKDLIKGSAIWETEAKPGENLDLYYEASQAIPLYLTNETNELFAPIGSKVEILLNDAKNGQFTIDGDILLESWNNADITVTGGGDGIDFGFNVKNAALEDVDYTSAQIRFFRPDGSYTTTRLTGIPQPQTGDFVAIFNLDPNLDASMEQGLNYFNCYSFGNGIESNRVRDDFNAPSISKGVKASLVLDQEYKEENRKNGLIYSGIYNSTSGINNLNQFIMAENITKDLNPTYGSIQKLFQRRISLVAFCEDRTISITSNKDALFNADGNVQLVSTNSVLGDATPFVGDYGISKNPESFAKESYRAYFADKQRGAVLRLSMDGITPISDAGMDDYFRDNLKLSGEIIGSYDAHSKNYNVTLKGAKPEDNIIANSFISLGVESEDDLNLNSQEIIVDGNIIGYNNIESPTIDPVSNIYVNDVVNVNTTITNYDEIGIGELIAETFTITTTPLTNTTFATTSSSVLYSFSINSSDNPFTGNGQDNYTAVTSLSGGFDDNMDSHMYPVYHNNLLTPTTQRSQRDDFWSGVNGSGFFDHGPSGNIFWQQEADDYENGSFTVEPSGSPITYQNSSHGWQMGVPSADNPWFYAGTGVTTGYRGFIWDGMFEGNSTVQPVLALPGNRDADGNANNNLLLGQISTEYPNARNNTMFNGEEVKISFYFKHDPDLNENGTTTYSGPNGNTPRFVQIMLYDGIPGSGGAVLQSSKILDAANLPFGVTSSDYANYSQTPTTSTYELGYQTNRFVSFAEVDSTNNKLHVAYFKFTNGDELEGVCVDDLQVGFRVYNGDDGFGDRIIGHTYGNVGSVSIEKVFRLEECFTESSTSTTNNPPVPDAVIPAFATVAHALPGGSAAWSFKNNQNNVPYSEINFISQALVAYGSEFSDLTTYTLDQYESDGITPTGVTATYVFPTSGSVSNGDINYNDVVNGTYTTDDKLFINQQAGGVQVRQFSLSVAQDDWYMVDLIYNSYTAGSDITILSDGSSNGVVFEIVNTDIYGTSQDVLRAVFQIDTDQSALNKVLFLIPEDVIIEIEELKLIKINAPMTGGGITEWNFDTDPNSSEHSFDPPSIYGSANGIEFNADASDSQRYVYQNFTTSPIPTNDGYTLQFEISNYVSGSLDMYAISSVDGITIEDVINADGSYSIDFNFDDNSYDFVRDGVVLGQTTPASLHSTLWTNLVAFLSDSDNGFIGCVKNISLVDATNYFTGASIDSFNISGFDQQLYEYIDFQDMGGDGQIVFTNAPITGNLPTLTNPNSQVQIQQAISQTIQQDDTYRLSFEHDISAGGSIGVYYFSDIDNKGFKVESITGTNTYNVLHAMDQDYIADHLKNTLVFFVSSDNTSGTIDNIILNQEFVLAETETISFSEDVRGWVSKKSFIPEQGVSISSEYFTINKGRLYEHNSKIEDRNTFYGSYVNSTITAVLNESPSSVKIFNTLNYEGSQSNVIAGDAAVPVGGNTYNTLDTYNLIEDKGWSVEYLKTDKQEGTLNEFIEKEGKWFNYIKGLSTDITDIKTSDLSFQGLGIVKKIDTI